MRFVVFGMGLLLLSSTPILAAEQQPQPTDPMSSSRAPDSKPTTGHSTFDAPDKPPGPWGEIPGGGGPSGYNDGATQKAPQYEGEKFKTAEQSERDALSKPGGKDAPDAPKSSAPDQQSQSGQQAGSSNSQSDDVAKRDAERHQHHQTISPEHLGPQGGSTAESGKAKQEERARAEQEAAKPQGSF
jgi:hypothetical protein